MATLHLEPPASFPFSHPDERQHWEQRFQQFKLASGLSAEENSRQVNTLLYCKGNQAEDMLAFMNISEDDRENYSRVIAKFDAFFQNLKEYYFRQIILTEYYLHENLIQQPQSERR